MLEFPEFIQLPVEELVDAFLQWLLVNFAAVFDAIMVGVANRLKGSNINNVKGFVHKYDELLRDKELYSACKTATSDEINVKNRIDISMKYFANIS